MEQSYSSRTAFLKNAILGAIARNSNAEFQVHVQNGEISFEQKLSYSLSSHYPTPYLPYYINDRNAQFVTFMQTLVAQTLENSWELWLTAEVKNRQLIINSVKTLPIYGQHPQIYSTNTSHQTPYQALQFTTSQNHQPQNIQTHQSSQNTQNQQSSQNTQNQQSSQNTQNQQSSQTSQNQQSSQNTQTQQSSQSSQYQQSLQANQSQQSAQTSQAQQGSQHHFQIGFEPRSREVLTSFEDVGFGNDGPSDIFPMVQQMIRSILGPTGSGQENSERGFVFRLDPEGILARYAGLFPFTSTSDEPIPVPDFFATTKCQKSEVSGAEQPSVTRPKVECSICQDTIKENCIQTQCRHHFHEPCITSWYKEYFNVQNQDLFQRKPQCPMCKSDL